MYHLGSGRGCGGAHILLLQAQLIEHLLRQHPHLKPGLVVLLEAVTQRQQVLHDGGEGLVHQGVLGEPIDLDHDFLWIQ